MFSREELRKKYEADKRRATTPQAEQFIDNPRFFHDSDSVGDILSQAREAVANSQELQSQLGRLREALAQAEQEAAEAQYDNALRSRLQSDPEARKRMSEKLKTEWQETREKLERETTTLREELKKHRERVEHLRRELAQARDVEVSDREQAKLSQTIDEVAQDAEQMRAQLDKTREQRGSVEALVASAETANQVISEREWRFLTLGYFNVLEGRLKRLSLDHPITGEHYPPDAWKIKRNRRQSQLEATLGKRWLRRAAFQIKAAIPEPESDRGVQGYVYRPAGEEWLDKIQGATQSVRGDAYSIYAVAAPTGFTDDLEAYARQLYAPNASVFLIDLQEGRVIYNTADAKTEELAYLMEPDPIDKQLGPLRQKLHALLEAKSHVTLEEAASELDAPPALLAVLLRELSETSEFNLYLEDDQRPQEALLHRV